MVLCILYFPLVLLSLLSEEETTHFFLSHISMNSCLSFHVLDEFGSDYNYVSVTVINCIFYDMYYFLFYQRQVFLPVFPIIYVLHLWFIKNFKSEHGDPENFGHSKFLIV